MDGQFITDSLPLYAQAAWLTLRIAVLGIVASLLIGAFCAPVQHARVPGLRQVVAAYVELSRNTPLLVQLFFLYFGLPKVGIRLESETCAVVGLAFLGGSYMAEALRSGLESVGTIQVQSALSLGLSRAAAMRHVVAPQAVAVAFPALTANVIFLVKEVSVVSVVALPDLVYLAKEQIGNTYNTPEVLTLLVGFYLLLLLPISLVARWAEGRVNRGLVGA